MRLLALAIGLSVLAWGCADGDGPPSVEEPDGGLPDANDTGGGDGGVSDGERTCEPEPGLGVDPALFTTECGSCEGTAHCVPESVVPADAQSLLGPCEGTAGELCVPDKFIENSNYVPIVCTSLNGVEGRCLSTCIPQVAEQASLLPQANCDVGEVCAPCYDPTTCEDTGACTQSCDAPQNPPPPQCESGGITCPYDGPPIVDPTQFPECGGGGAHCVPPSQVPEEQLTLLADCPGGTDKCVPDEFIESGGQALPDTCTSIGGLEGRCLHQSIPQVAEQADLLEQDTCEADELCAPCYDPSNGFASTGACEIACDAPTTDPPACPYEGPDILDPAGFPACGAACGGAAHCLPNAQVGADLLARLATCDADTVCVPDEFIRSAGNGVPETCQAGGLEGRCLSTCLPEIAEQADLLSQGTCDPDELCAPCYDPRTGESTGACDLACDMPVDPAPVLECPYEGPDLVDPSSFPACDLCGGGARCVPEAEVPAEQRALLAECDATSYCVPDDFVRTGGLGVPQTCTSVGGLEGRCLSECIPQVSEQASILPQDVCDEFELCAPCYDPTTGVSTGACEVACDMPVDPAPVLECPYTGPDLIDPSTLESCGAACAGQAHCLPSSLVDADLQSRLDACDAESFCVPDEFIRTGGQGVPESCMAAGLEGRCLSTCLPEIAAQADLLLQGTCDMGEVCAPCYDPRTGEDTGACTLACDMPVDPAPVLECPYEGPDLVDPAAFEPCPMCTEGAAHCVPKDQVPDDQEGMLAECDSTHVCVPDEFIVSNSLAVPETCRTLGDREARCLSVCLPDIADQSDFLSQETCGAGELCAPCYDPITGEDTQACRQACDAPAEGPSLFAECCSGLSRCVPASAVPDDQEGSLVVDTCNEGAGELCVPDAFLEDSPQLTACTAVDFLIGIPLGSGVCLPECLSGAGLVGQSTCGENEKCIPCSQLPDPQPAACQ